MRRRITKANKGRSMINRKEVSLRINKSGLNSDGSQRYCVAIRFANESYKKASNTDYVAIEIDDELQRMYFLSSNNEEGYKLSKNRNASNIKNVTFAIDNVEEWKIHEGTYDLLIDNAEHIYYIDFAKKN